MFGRFQGTSSLTELFFGSAPAFEGEVLSLGQMLCLRGWALQMSLCKPAAPSSAPVPVCTDSVASAGHCAACCK